VTTVLHFLSRRLVKAALMVLILASLIAYLFPFDIKLPITLGTQWTYHYMETLSSGGNLSSVYEADWRYLVVNSLEDTVYVEINSTSRLRHRLENGSWAEVNVTESGLSIVNVKTRLYDYGSFCSWWVPANLQLGDTVSIWNLNLKVTGLTWRIVRGRLLECWVLEGGTPPEAYTFYYERTTGFFIHLVIKYIYPTAELLIERTLISTNLPWPALTFVRPFLIPTVIGAVALLLLPLIKRVRRPKKKLPESLTI